MPDVSPPNSRGCSINSYLSYGLSFRLKLGRSLPKSARIQMSSSESKDNLYSVVGTAGVVSNIICGYSLFVLKTTGCGLPARPFGLVGAAEGISYLTVVSILGWSLATKVKTGSGNAILISMF